MSEILYKHSPIYDVQHFKLWFKPMEEKLSEMLSFRVTPSEKKRAKQIAKEIKMKLPYVTEAIVFRELFGFTDTGLITPELRAKLRSDTDT